MNESERVEEMDETKEKNMKKKWERKVGGREGRTEEEKGDERLDMTKSEKLN